MDLSEGGELFLRILMFERGEHETVMAVWAVYLFTNYKWLEMVISMGSYIPQMGL